MNSLEDLREVTAPLLKEISDINRKYDFNYGKRSAEDNARFKELWDKVYQLELEYDKKFPLSPCSECGGERRASLHDACTNFMDCKKAPLLGG